jgi:hypothetical protein
MTMFNPDLPQDFCMECGVRIQLAIMDYGSKKTIYREWCDLNGAGFNCGPNFGSHVPVGIDNKKIPLHHPRGKYGT